MKVASVAKTLVVVMLVLAVHAAATAPSRPRRLTDASPSVDALLERFREALVAKDKAALRALRVTQDEYLGIIMPGSVEPGQPRAQYSAQAQQYFWGILNGKSIYVEADLLYQYGGHPFRITGVSFRRGIKDYADYRAYRQLTLAIEDDAGKVDHLKIGSIAEVDGQFKFISYVRD
ncbi:MAG TPA: hypothetical protein VFA06_25100 [Actinocrinis sp.]|uniref:hypothetical protein n=1 Tax=Actinocrinis sp. TaxID=1920516 RepID=UPI002D2F9AFF|nr:hypothetical protein [Actinocrinis sp.]HZU59182.1 hypothetical protein [Actinocrinis sp.]